MGTAGMGSSRDRSYRPNGPVRVGMSDRNCANKSLELEIEDILFRAPGRPSLKSRVRYKSFRYQAES